MRRCTSAILAGIITLLLTVPGAAFAGTRTASVPLPGAGATAAVTAKCPHGRRATGGGFQVPTSSAAVYESRKAGQRGWRVGAQSESVAPSGNLTALAQCSRTALPTATKAFTAQSVTPNQIWNVNAGCPLGKVQAGGFSVAPALSARVTDSFRLAKKKWRVVVDLGAAQANTLTAFAYCGPGKVKARTASVSSSGNNPVSALSGNCPVGTKLLSGGFSQSPASTKPITLLASIRSGRAWLTSGQNNTGAGTLDSFAYCG
jgi:hypothetical protein